MGQARSGPHTTIDATPRQDSTQFAPHTLEGRQTSITAPHQQPCSYHTLKEEKSKAEASRPSPNTRVSTTSNPQPAYTQNDRTDDTSVTMPGTRPDEQHKGKDHILKQHEERVKKIWPAPSQMARKEFPEFCTLYDKIKLFNCPNYLGARIPLVSDLNIDQWRAHLIGYHDELLCEFLLYGWPLGYHADNPPRTVDDNHPSARAHAAHVHKFIEVEEAYKAIIGPFKEPPFIPWTRVSPIMTRPKRDSDERRIIIDLSYPVGWAVNDGIDTANHFGTNITYSLPSISDLVERIKQQGKGCFLWKADLTRAYRQWRVDPLDTPFLGMKVEDGYYLDLCPPFGCRSSAAICQKIANAVTYIMGKKNCYTIAYLDDYAGANAEEAEALKVFTTFRQLAHTLGLHLAEHKCCAPSTQMEWLGYSIDTVKMQVAIPPIKLGEVLAECCSWITKTKVNKKMIQSLAGKLVYISNCIKPGRKFTARILATLRSLQDRQWTTIDKEFKADLHWFASYAASANGILMFPPHLPVINIECDSSLEGAGAHDNENCYSWKYSVDHMNSFPDIVHLEAINVVVAFRTLVIPKAAAPLAVIIWTDNLGSSYALESGRTRDSTLAACARELWLMAATNNCTISIRHKHGHLIQLADALSRMNQDKQKEALAMSLVSARRLLFVEPVLNDYIFFTPML